MTDDLGLPPSAVTPTIVADTLADAKGEARSKVETLPPPGTTRGTFWNSPATKNAIITTVSVGLLFVYSAIDGEPPSADAIKIAVATFVGAWMGAFGIVKTDTDALRWK